MTDRQAVKQVRAQVAAWQEEGRKFFVRRDFDQLLAGIQRSPGWLYGSALPVLARDGIVAVHRDGRLTRWEITAAGQEERVMTDRHAAYIVVLREDIREDDAQAVMTALRMTVGVVSVEPVEADYGQVIARSRRDSAWRQALGDLALKGPGCE